MVTDQPEAVNRTHRRPALGTPRGLPVSTADGPSCTQRSAPRLSKASSKELPAAAFAVCGLQKRS